MLTIEITFDSEPSANPVIAYAVELDETGTGTTIPEALRDLAESMPDRAPEHGIPEHTEI